MEAALYSRAHNLRFSTYLSSKILPSLCPVLCSKGTVDQTARIFPVPFLFGSRWGRGLMQRTNRPFCRDESGIITWGWSTSIRSNREVLYLVGLALHKISGWSGSHKIWYVGSLYTNTPVRLSIKRVCSKKHNLLFLLTKAEPCKLTVKVKTLLASLPQTFTDLCF